MEIAVIFEDSEIVVIDKPSGLVCNRAVTVSEPTLQDWWDGRYQKVITNNQNTIINESEDEKYFVERSGLVHRLDRETSGVMVMAKTVEAFVSLLKQFKEHSVKKEYLALTHGYWAANEGDINLPLARRRDDRKKFGVREDGRESITHYEVVSEYTNWEFPKELKVDDRGYVGFSLVSFKPKTGRTHQIRVHSQQLGHPLVGDMDYAGRKRSREDRKWAMRVMLQAQKIEFEHPRNGKRIHFESKNEELQEVLKYLGGEANQTPGV
jgi:23S rRNA pseudouridine1911/1915/1917 synthase